MFHYTGNPNEYSYKLYITRKFDSLGYIFAAGSKSVFVAVQQTPKQCRRVKIGEL